MKNILMTAAGTGTAFSYAVAIAKNFEDEIALFTADTNPEEFVTSSLFSKKHFQAESIYSKEYLSNIKDILSENKIDLYIPLIDLEVEQSSKDEMLREYLAANEHPFVKNCIEKSNYHVNFNVKKLKFPKKFSLSNLESDKHYMVKEDGGFGGRGSKVQQGLNINECPAGIAIYEYITGTEYTVDCFPYDRDVFVSIRQRLEVKNGVCTKALIVKDMTLNNISLEISEKFKLKHPFCFQVIVNDDGYYLIDVNPRLGAGSAMSAANGMDFFSAHLALLIGEDPTKYLKRYNDSCVVTRQYSNYLMKVI